MSSALVTVRDEVLDADITRLVEDLVRDCVASRIGERDPSVWAPGVTDGLGWVGLARASRPLLGQVAGLRERFRVAGADRVLLVAAPGHGRAGELLAGAPTRLTVLDGADPGQVADALAGDLGASVLVVADPAGEPGPTATVTGLVTDALRAEGLDPPSRTVVLTEPGSQLDARATAGGATVVTTEADVAARFAALGVPGLVPAGLAGADVAAVLDDAAATAAGVTPDDPDNPALRLAAALAARPGPLALHGGPVGLADWVAELVGGSLGGHGPVPVVTGGIGPGGTVTGGSDLPDAQDGPGLAVGLGGGPAPLSTSGPVGAQVVLWQHAVAAAARLVGADPFAPVPPPEPGAPAGAPAFTDGDVDVHAGPWLSDDARTVADALHALVSTAAASGPGPASAARELAVTAWLDRIDDASAAVLRAELARRTGLTTTFGWAPRDRAGWARRHRDAPHRCVVVQLTGESEHDLPELAGMAAAEAAADGAALARLGAPVLRLHLRDRLGGLVTVAKAVQQLGATDRT